MAENKKEIEKENNLIESPQLKWNKRNYGTNKKYTDYVKSEMLIRSQAINILAKKHKEELNIIIECLKKLVICRR